MKKLIAICSVVALALVLLPAASAQIYVKNGGNLGIGDYFETNDPTQPLHVAVPGNPVFKFQSTTTLAQFNFKINANGDFSISKVGSAGAELILFEVGDPKVLDINGAIEATSFDMPSSRAFKKGFEPVSPSEALAKVAEMPITRWQYKDDPRDTTHIGPMAEDFQAAFDTGTGDKSISLTDASGVAFAAIQGLHEVVREREAEIATLRQSQGELKELASSRETEIRELRQSRDDLAARLEVLERLVFAQVSER